MYRIKLCQLNLLAPMWVNEEYKVLPWYDLYVDPKRLNHTLAYLKDLDADIYCLCEVEARQLGKLDKAFPNYHRMFTSNAASFWSEWATPVHGKKAEWMPNGTCTLLNSDIYELKDHAYINLGKGNQLGEGDGCRCTIVKARHKASGYSILVATVHFDTEVKKFMEAFTLIEA
jgi:endonuclease/exonuclease/phosphatase family metal-dependent hydrolase